MRKIKNKFILSFFFIALILTGIVSFGTNSASAFTVPEDGFEENDDFWSASPITNGYYSNLCQGDDDWFNISIGVDEVIKVSLYFDGYLNNIELELYDNSQGILDSSYGVDSYESVVWLSSVPQYVYIRTFGYDNNESYDMNVEIFPKGTYDDEYEDNEDFSQAQEHEIYPNFYHNLVNNDTDIYRIYFDNDFSIDIYNSSLLWASLYNDAENELTTFFVQDSHLVLDWVPTYHGYYYIFVTGPDLGDLYDMDIWITGPIDDWAEPNDYLGESYEVGLGYYDGLVQNDDDWYKIWLNPNDPLKIDLYYDTGYTWMNLELFNEYENNLASGELQSDGVHLSWVNGNDGGYYYIKVSGNNNGDWYQLNLNLNDQMGDDWAEDNDDLNNAWYLDLGYHSGLTQIDDDWYEVWLEPNDILEIYLNYDTALTSLNIELYYENEILITSSYDTTQLTWNNDDTGRYIYIRVFGPGNGDWYDIDLKNANKDGNGADNNGDNPFANFDLSSIPGFPIEIVGFSVILSSLALIFFVKKKKH